MTSVSHTEISGDFNSAYTVKVSSRERRTRRAYRLNPFRTLMEAKWAGACAADQRAGDMIMPGGVKINIKDMEKLKDLIPKQVPK